MSGEENPLTAEQIRSGSLDGKLRELYGAGTLDVQRDRYLRTAQEFFSHFGNFPERFFSSPGRTELGGNHTDHNRGRVLAASIQLDKTAAVSPSRDSVVRIFTEGFDETVEVDLSRLQPIEEERGTSRSLVRGIAAFFHRSGYSAGGFTAYVTSNVAMGSGLSSSASIEVLIAEIFNSLYNEDRLSPVDCARAGQWAENTFFGKPCGLMDQIACAHGGVVGIDFANPEKPELTPIHFSFSEHGYRLCILDTGADHANLTGDYTAIPEEMGCAARLLGAGHLRDASKEALLSKVKEIRGSCGDRAVLRAFHFFNEHERAGKMAENLRADDMEGFLGLVRESASSSWRFLQNCIPEQAGSRQDMALALGLAEEMLGDEGAVRVHGGGFAGTIQLYVPDVRLEELKDRLESVFGEGALTELEIRGRGVTSL